MPTAKLVNGKAYSIISDHLGTPILAVDSEGNELWNRQLDIYGRVKREIKASSLGEEVRPFIPFLYQGQYYDFETNLAYNRFRYYSPETGAYISQDPIGLAGGNPNIYAYVKDSNIWLDLFGLATCEEEIKKLPPFTGLSREEIHKIANDYDYVEVKNHNGNQTFLKDTDDGKYAVIRTDSANPNSGPDKADSVAHSHKETATDFFPDSNGQGFTRKRDTTVYNDSGEVITRDPNDPNLYYFQAHIPMSTNN